MNPNETRRNMINHTKMTSLPSTTGPGRFGAARLLLLGLAGGILIAGCGPTFDPASLIDKTRVLGARIEVEGAPERASPRPGETANVTWLITSPEVTPPLRWTFAVCMPGNGSLTCDGAPLALFAGTDTPPRITFLAPGLDALGAAKAVVVYGQICAGADSVPIFDPQHGIPSCTSDRGTTVSVSVPLQLGDDANRNPIADRAFTFDGQAWPGSAAADDPCVAGPRVTPGSKDHVIGNTTDGSDREGYTALLGAPPVATPARESLEVSQFTTAGKLKSQFSFVEATNNDASTIVDVKWEAPEAAEVPTTGLPVTFTFVVRDNRGGTDWTTRAACVTRS
jgi:hypothetical protein